MSFRTPIVIQFTFEVLFGGAMNKSNDLTFILDNHEAAARRNQ